MPGEGAFAGLDVLLADIVRGDLAMRARSLLAAQPDSPALLVATGVRAELSYQAQRADTSRLAWLTHRGEQPVADMCLSLALRPTLASSQPTVAPRLELAAPVFLAAAPRAAKTLRLVFGGAPLDIRFPKDRLLHLPGRDEPLEVALPSRDGAEPQGFAGDYLSTWPVETLVAVLDGIAAWRRQGEPRQAVPFSVPPNPLLGGLLLKVTGVYRDVAEILDGDPPDPDGRLAALRADLQAYSPLLAGALALEEIGARIKLYVDDYGELARRPDSIYRQRLDIDVEQGGSVREPTLRFAVKMEDFLVGGELHARFLAALRTPAAAEALWKGLPRPSFMDEGGEATPVFKKEAIAAYLADRHHDASAVIVRMRHDDTDLVLLRSIPGGNPLELLYQVTFTAGAIEKPMLAAIRYPGQPWRAGTGQTIAPRFFYRLFQTLFAWQAGIGATA